MAPHGWPVNGDDQPAQWPRFRWLIPGALAGAPHPELYGGLPALTAVIQAEGVGAIVTLGTEPLPATPEDPELDRLFVHVENYRPPPNLAAILDFIDAAIANEKPVVVHCFAGIGRTGTVLVAWLLRHHPGMTADQAIHTVRSQYIPAYAHSRFPEDPTQEVAMRAFAVQRARPTP